MWESQVLRIKLFSDISELYTIKYVTRIYMIYTGFPENLNPELKRFCKQ
jgi:hypothetical protein